MKRLKILTAAIAASVLVSSSLPVFAANIYDITKNIPIASGIVQKDIKRLTSKGWQNITIIEADLSEERYGLKALTDTENLSKLTNVKDLANANGTLAAINGDFFSWKKDERTLGSAIGGIISDGVMLTSPTSPWNFATVARKSDGSFIFDYIDCAIAVATPNGYITPIEHVNKYDDLTLPIIYTKEWGPLSIGSSGTQKEIVIEDDIVVSVNHDMGPIPFPENGYIISFLSDVSPELLENFNVGDKVELGINYEPKFEDIEFAVGAGTLLLKDGKKTENVNDIKGNQPRTAIGVDEGFETLYFVTVDGRQKNAKGVTIDELADIMIEAGAHHAANLDGGGSTTLSVKWPYTGQQSIQNSPSESSLRPVANAIGIVPLKEADKKGFITIETDSDNVFKGTGMFFNVKVHDSNGNIIDFNPDDLKWSAEGGKMEDSFYIPEETGKFTVKVNLDGMSAEKEVRVIENPVKISTGIKEYKIKKNESAYITVTAEGEKGFRAYLNLKDVDITSDSSAIEVDGNYIKGIKKGTAVVTFDFGDVQTSAIVRVDGDTREVSVPKDITVEDSIYETPREDAESFKFAVFGNTSSKNTLTEKLVVLKYAENLNTVGDCALAVFAGENILTPGNIATETLKTEGFSSALYKNSLFITMDNSKGSVADTDADQWIEFLKEAKNTKADNVFIILPNKTEFEKNMEATMIADIAQKYFQDKNLYVISSGEGSVQNRDGVKHITATGVNAIKSPQSATEDAVYSVFTVSGKDVRMETRKIYNN